MLQHERFACARRRRMLILFVGVLAYSAPALIRAQVETPESFPTPPEQPVYNLTPPVTGDELDVPGLRQFMREQFEPGDLGWVMLGAAACLLLIAPGLLVFYSGILRARDISALAALYLLLAAVLSIFWCLGGYSLAFARNANSLDTRPWEIESEDRTDLPGSLLIGGRDHVALQGFESQLGTHAPRFPVRRPIDPIPHVLFFMLQNAFYIAVLVPLVVPLASRLRLGGLLLFLVLWTAAVYAPITYWLWGGGFYTAAIDTAGGITFHVAVGFAALASGLVLRDRTGRPELPEIQLNWLVTGTVLVWAGMLIWSGSRTLAADGYGANAFMATHLAASTGLIGWAGSQWALRGRVAATAYGLGPVAGIVAIAAGSGYVAPQSAMVIGFLGGVVGCWTYAAVQRWGGYVPEWKVFAIQAVPGLLGVLLAGVFASSSIGGFKRTGQPIVGLLGGNPGQVVTQLLAGASAAALAVLATVLIALFVRRVGGMRPADV